MAKQIEGVYERVMECAKQEFLEKGFMDASLRAIAQNAQTSTGSIYTRFKDKEGLFREIVEPTVQGMTKLFIELHETFHQMDSQTQEREMKTYSSLEKERMLDYMYDHFDEFRLLLDASYGTRFQSFIDKLVDVEVDYTYKYMDAVGCPEEQAKIITEGFIHIAMTAFFNGLFEVIRHSMNKADAAKYLEMLDKYHRSGFLAIFYPEKLREF